MSRLNGKPRIIRLVIKTDAKGRPKVARDRNTGIQMERVQSKITKPCCYHGCWQGLITSGVEYALVFANQGKPIRVKGRDIYSPRAYHFACVPDIARPLVRFLKPN